MFKKLTALLLTLTLLFALTACTVTITDGNLADDDDVISSEIEEASDEITITVAVTFPDGTTKDYEIETDAEFLRGALEDEDLVEGEESQYGLYVHKVDGVSDEDGYYWAFYKDGEYLMTGVDTTPIADGDKFEIKYESYETGTDEPATESATDEPAADEPATSE